MRQPSPVNRTPPDLEIHKTLSAMRGGEKPTTRTLYEVALVETILAHLDLAGFDPVQVWIDSNEEYKGNRAEPATMQRDLRLRALEKIFNLDESIVVMKDRLSGKTWNLFLVLGNGQDVLTDYHSPDPEKKVGQEASAATRWRAALDSFEPESFESWERAFFAHGGPAALDRVRPVD